MNACACAVLAVLSVYDYPARQPSHEATRAQYLAASAKRDAAGMEKAGRRGAELLPDDPVWAYNLACSLALQGKRDEALDWLEKSVSLGFRDSTAISADADLKSVSETPRFEDVLEKADRLYGRPLLTGPLAAVPANAVPGRLLVVGEHNLTWDLDAGCFNASIAFDCSSLTNRTGNTGDIYFNRDGRHSVINVGEFPGLTDVRLDAEGRKRMLDLDKPNIVFDHPVFGNSSRALVSGPWWRSIPRALMTTDAPRLGLMHRLYMSNQVWVFPAVADCPPVGTNGDVFASVTPYWFATQGKSWSDRYYVKAALEVSRSLKPSVKENIVGRGLLAPTVQAIVRRSLKSVRGEDDYLTPKAHPTAFPANGLDWKRLKAAAAKMEVDAVPPVAVIKGVAAGRTQAAPPIPELTYATPCACALVLRAPDEVRTFAVTASGGDEYAFAVVHDDLGAAKVEQHSPGAGAAKVTLDRSRMSPTNRVDVAVFARTATSGWGAPSFVSFAVVDPAAPYSDPALTPGLAPGWRESAEEK